MNKAIVLGEFFSSGSSGAPPEFAVPVFYAHPGMNNRSGPDMELNLNGKVALVTGANRGIGAAIAIELAREGMHLCLVARDSDRLAQVADSLRHIANKQVQVVSADLRDPVVPQQAIAHAVVEKWSF